MSSLTFHWPWLLLLLPLPLLFTPRSNQQDPRANAARVPFYQAMISTYHPGSSEQVNSSIRRKLLLFLSWLCLITSLTRPVHIGDPVEVALSGRDLMLAVDISPSMKEKDMVIEGFQVNRLEAVKSVVGRFIKQREGDRVGLILFGSQPYVQSPLTFDRQTVNTLLAESMPGMAGRATAIGDAIGLAVKRLRGRPAESRVLILLTDGANTAGEIPPIQAAQLAAKEGIKIYTIGMGAEQGARRGLFSIRPSSDLDEHTLKEIARLTSGEYLRARSAPELELVYEAINQLEPTEREAKVYRPEKELYFWPLTGALVLLGVHVATRLRWRRRQDG
ncbi:MAG: BatB protein [Proteobacteria bacterium]|nr:MAG: BatB protein [Pseudomonadota bacterium]PIE40363.1 MAG: BatB protein [Gammaproteobacteria bacterium]